nr:hypothetical protein [Streptococcus equi]
MKKIEQFVDDHRPLVLICLAIFILIVLLLALMAFRWDVKLIAD